MCLGLSGVDRAPDVILVQGWMRRLKDAGDIPEDCQIIIHNDAVAALASGTMGVLEGVVVISGTGKGCHTKIRSIVYACVAVAALSCCGFPCN